MIGYENRTLANEDFNNDKVDAGEIGAGHSVTAIYELVLTDSGNTYHDPLRYQLQQPSTSRSNELAQVKIRYKQPSGDTSTMIAHEVEKSSITPFEKASQGFKFATSVVGFAQTLRHTKFSEGLSFQWIVDMANENKGSDPFGYRSEFVQLVRMASTLSDSLAHAPQHKGDSQVNR